MESLLLKLGNEVRQTLHHVMGLIELTSEEPLSDRQSQYLARTRESADGLVRTVNDVTELARPSAAVAEGACVGLIDALAEVAELMGVLASRKGLTFNWMVDPAVPSSIAGDKFLIQDMVRRLIDNAIRFTDEGNIRLSVTAAPGGAEPPELIFEVADSGPGIREDVLAALESPLGASPLQGLGLRIVKKRSAELGGKLSILSDTDGATVRLTIPAWASEEPAPNVAAAVETGRESAPLRLLVAEDSDESFLLLQAYTRAEGHHILRAHNGAEAVEMAKRNDYDFIVMDANMPVMDGYTATRLIREWETKQGQARRPILLLSADDFERQLRIGGAAGCSGFLTKPTTKAQVLTALSYYARPALEEPGQPPFYAWPDGRSLSGVC